MMISKRIQKETSQLLRSKSEDMHVAVDPANPRYFHIMMKGPKETPFEGGTFKLELFLPAEYPMGSPKVRFLTKIYHPNVDRVGRICLDILKDKWTPALQIRTVLLSIQALLDTPEPDDPLDPKVAEHWKSDPAGAKRKAAEWTAQYAQL
eukprot:m.358020 g.358020  ORF g.358020 m.358020 type:complete len:150 (+) comp18019_c0_seq1:324-773(+)